MRVLIIATGEYLDKRIERILYNNDINGDITQKVSRSMILNYDCIIFSYKNDIPNLPKVVEMIVLENKKQVIYVSNTSAIGQFYNTVDELYFNIVQELTMEIELPILIKSNTKYINEIKRLERKNSDLREQLDFLKLTNKAKQLLMKKGLSEEESHKFIQHKAMDMRISKKKLVNLIIENKIDI